MGTRRGWGSIKRLPSGNWRASFQHRGESFAADSTFACRCKDACRGAADPEHPRRKPCEGYQDAVDALGEIRRKIQADDDWPAKHKREREARRVKPAAMPTVAEYARQGWKDPGGHVHEAWLERKRRFGSRGRPLSPNTLDSYRYHLDQHILPKWGSYDLDAVTDVAVQAWFDRLLPGKPTMRAHVYGTLVGVFQQAVKDRLVDRSPCQVEGGMTKKRVREEPDELTVEQLKVMIDATPDRFKLLLQLAVYGGLRYGEAAELRRRDVDLKRGLIRVQRGVIRPRTGPVVKEPKTDAGKRDIVPPDEVLDALRDHLDRHAQPGLDGLLFSNYRGEQLSYSGRDMWWTEARAAAGWNGSYHDLRHVAGTWKARTGATIRELMDFLGHTTPAMAMRYQQKATVERKRELANLMPKLEGNVVPIVSKRRRKKTG